MDRPAAGGFLPAQDTRVEANEEDTTLTDIAKVGTVVGIGAGLLAAPLPTLGVMAATGGGSLLADKKGAKAAFRTENVVGSSLSDKSGKYTGDFEPDYDPWDDIGGTEFEPYWENFAEARTPEHADLIKQDIVRERKDREYLESQGMLGFAQSMAAGMFDLPSLLPGGAIVRTAKGASKLRTGLKVGAFGTAGAGVAEGVLQSTQELRTPEESAMNIAGATILSGVLGYGMASRMNSAEMSALGKRVEQDFTPPDRSKATPSTEPQTSIPREMDALETELRQVHELINPHDDSVALQLQDELIRIDPDRVTRDELYAIEDDDGGDFGIPARRRLSGEGEDVSGDGASPAGDGRAASALSGQVEATPKGGRTPVSGTETFPLEGFTGIRTAEIPAPGRIAARVYRVYPEGVKVNRLKSPVKSLGEPLGELRISQHEDGRWEVGDVEIGKSIRRQKVATRLYDQIEADLGIKMRPSGHLFKDGYAFWKNRNPEAVKYHRYSDMSGEYLSPRQIRNSMDQLDKALAKSSGEPEQLVEAMTVERAELQSLWDELPAEVKTKPALAQMYSIRGYHGSPHDFDRFDMSKVGSGEGTQEQGHGIYLSPHAEIGEGYYLTLGAHKTTVNGVPVGDDPDLQAFAVAKISGKDGYGRTIDEIVAGQEDALRRAEAVTHPRRDEFIAEAEARLEKAIRVRDGDVKAGGTLYEVEIGAEAEQLLDHAQPVGNQPGILPTLKKIYSQYGIDDGNLEQQYGSEVYDAIAAATGSERQASMLLSSEGIPGSSYELGGFTHYVIFDDSILKITKKNGEPVEAEERQGVVDQMFALGGESRRDLSYSPEAALRFERNITQQYDAISMSDVDRDFSGGRVLAYHGTGEAFEKFDKFDSFGVHFGTVEQATDMGNHPHGGNIIPVIVDVKNVIETHDLIGWHPDKLARNLAKADMELANLPDQIAGLHRSDAYAIIRTRLRDAGYDGIKYLNDVEGSDGYSIMVWNPGKVRSVFTGDTMFALRGFYSPAIRAAENISQAKGTGEQFLKQITKAPGVRKDELEWMGLEESLADKKSITKDEVLAFMRAHQVELDEKILGTEQDLPTSSEAIAPDQIPQSDIWEGVQSAEKFTVGDSEYYIIKIETIDAYYVADEGGYELFDSPTLSSARHEAIGHYGSKNRTGTRFSGNKVPGGENYREMLIRLPQLGKRRLTADQRERLVAIEREQKELQPQINEAQFGSPKRKELIDKGSRLVAEQEAIMSATEPYTSRHFYDSEIVHLRVDDRVGPNGERVLFVNEIQSDLHQRGRKSGYGESGKAVTAKRRAEIDAEEAALLERQQQPDFRDLPAAEREDIRSRLDALDFERGSVSRAKTPPNGPFKGDLWLELALKRALLYASENGYDAVSWARGDQIAKAVGGDAEALSVQYDQKIGSFLKKYTKKWGGKVEEENLGIRSESHSRDEIAIIERARDTAPTDEIREDIGGYLESFEVDVPTALKAESRAHIEAVAVESGRAVFNPNSLLRITPEMRSSVMEGQPLAMRRDSQGNLVAEAKFEPEKQLITISRAALDPVNALHHEAVHALKSRGLFTPKEWTVLADTAKSKGWLDAPEIKDYEKIYGRSLEDESIIEEAVALAFQRHVKGDEIQKGALAKIFDRITAYLERVANYVRTRGFNTAEDIFRAIEQGDIGARAAPERRTDTAGTGFTAAGAQASQQGDVRLKGALGTEKALAFLSPAMRLQNSPSRAARSWVNELAETALTYEDHKSWIVTARGGAELGQPGSVETRVKLYDTNIAAGFKALDNLFIKYRKGAGRRIPGDLTVTSLRDATAGPPTGKMDYRQFREAVSAAMRRGDEHDIPEVAEAAKVLRKEVFDPLLQRAIELELLPEDVTPETAASYLNRIYNKERIVAERTEFRDVITKWLQETEVHNAQVRGRISGLLDEFKTNQGKLKALNQKIERRTQRLAEMERAGEEVSRFNKFATERSIKMSEPIDEIRTEINTITAKIEEQLTRIQELSGEIRTQKENIPGLQDVERQMQSLSRALSDVRKRTEFIEQIEDAGDIEESLGELATSFQDTLSRLRTEGRELRAGGAGEERLPSGMTQEQMIYQASQETTGDSLRIMLEDYEQGGVVKKHFPSGEKREVLDRMAGDVREILAGIETGDRPRAVRAIGNALIEADALEKLHSGPEARLFTQWVRTAARNHGVESLPPARPVFKTAKGSSYTVNEDGTTTRDKAFRKEHGEKEQGPQPRSEVTFYVTPEEANALGEIQAQGTSGRIVAQTSDGRYGVKYTKGKGAGKFERRTVVTPKTEPAVGLLPVELWNGGKRVHFGNKIVEVGSAATEAPQRVPYPEQTGEGRTSEAGQILKALENERARLSKRISPFRKQLRALRTDQKTLERRARPRAAEGNVYRTKIAGRVNTLADQISGRRGELESLTSEQSTRTARQNELSKLVEEQIGLYQGKSADEAKSALKSRGKTEEGRDADADRLASADKSVMKVARQIAAQTEKETIELVDTAEQIIDRILGTPEGRLPYDAGMNKAPNRNFGGVDMDTRGPLAARQFMIPDARIEQWLENDIDLMIRAYVHTMAPDIELTARFSSPDMVLQFKQINEEYAKMAAATDDPQIRKRLHEQKKEDFLNLGAIRDRLRGTYALPENPDAFTVRAIRGMMTMNYMRMLGGMTISALPDVSRFIHVHGVMGTFGDGIIPMFRNFSKYKKSGDEAKMLSGALELVTDNRAMRIADITDTFGRHTKFERGMQAAGRNFGFVSLMAPWNAVMKQLAGTVTQTRILRGAEKMFAGKPLKQKEIEYFADLGISEGALRQIGEQFKKHGHKEANVWSANTAQWDEGMRPAIEALRVGLRKEVDRLIITPSLGERPRFASTLWGSMLLQFKSFAISATQKMLISGLQQKDLNAMNGAVLAVALGGMVHILKGALSGRDVEVDWGNEEDVKQFMGNAFDRSGMAGVLMEANNVAEKVTDGRLGLSALTGKPISRYASRNVTASLLGPAFGMAEDGFDALNAALGTREWKERDSHNARQLLPYNNLFYLRSVFDNAEKGINQSLGVPAR